MADSNSILIEFVPNRSVIHVRCLTSSGEEINILTDNRGINNRALWCAKKVLGYGYKQTRHVNDKNSEESIDETLRNLASRHLKFCSSSFNTTLPLRFPYLITSRIHSFHAVDHHNPLITPWQNNIQLLPVRDEPVLQLLVILH
jgi:hypothetical protein